MSQPLDLEAIENRLDFGHADAWALLEEVKRLRAESAGYLNDRACALIDRDGAIERSKLLLQAKNEWVARATAAENDLADEKAVRASEHDTLNALSARLEKAREAWGRFKASDRLYHAYPCYHRVPAGGQALPGAACTCGLEALRDLLGAPC